MATSEAAILTSATTSAPNWLISKKDDWTWIFGGAVASYVILAAFFAGLPIMVMSLVMLLLLEAPHVFATATRSYLDKAERQRFGWFLLLLIPLTFLGPTMVWLGLAKPFFALSFCWLHIHYAKQHLGFVMLYKRKAGEFDDIKLDKYFLLTSLTLPLFFFFAYSRETASIILGLSAIYLMLAVVYAARQLSKPKLVLPKLWLMGLIVPLQWLAFWYADHSGHGIKVAGILIGLGHALQYHKLTMVYHRAEFKETGDKKLWHSLGGYLFVIIGLNLVFNVLPRGFAESDYAFAALWGMSFQHYLLDGKLWKTKDFPIFRKALGI